MTKSPTDYNKTFGLIPDLQLSIKSQRRLLRKGTSCKKRASEGFEVIYITKISNPSNDVVAFICIQ